MEDCPNKRDWFHLLKPVLIWGTCFPVKHKVRGSHILSASVGDKSILTSISGQIIWSQVDLHNSFPIRYGHRFYRGPSLNLCMVPVFLNGFNDYRAYRKEKKNKQRLVKNIKCFSWCLLWCVFKSLNVKEAALCFVAFKTIERFSNLQPIELNSPNQLLF